MRDKKQTIGLLGGSFNPAHAGHLHLSKEAIRRLGLDAVWWLISPQNPLKNADDLADYETRLTHAQTLCAAYPRIHVSDFEAIHHLRYSIDTVTALQHAYPRTRFVWLMGADNLASFHRWRHWQQLAQTIPIAVFDRAPFSHASLHSPMAQRYRQQRLPERDARALSHSTSPAWIYCTMPRHPLSSTALRKTLGKNAFICHNSNIGS